MRLTAHQIAKKLLAGPDLTVRFQDEESAYSGFVVKVDKDTGQFCDCDDFDENDNARWGDCITLEVGSTDGILRGDSVIER